MGRCPRPDASQEEGQAEEEQRTSTNLADRHHKRDRQKKNRGQALTLQTGITRRGPGRRRTEDKR